MKINPLFDYKYRNEPVLIFVIKTALKILINLGSSTVFKITTTWLKPHLSQNSSSNIYQLDQIDAYLIYTFSNKLYYGRLKTKHSGRKSHFEI